MFNFNNSNNTSIHAINEYKTKKIETRSKTLEELYGMEFVDNKYKLDEPVLPNDLQQMQLRSNNEYKKIVNSDYYAHIRICGRSAQDKSESSSFLLDDLFRLYRFSLYSDAISTMSPMKIEYNQNANLWVFYISPELETENARHIWIQPPNHNGSIRAIVEGISKNSGLLLSPYDRNKTGFYSYIHPYREEIKDITTKHFKEFQKALDVAKDYFEEVKGREEARPSKSLYEWPYRLLYRK